MASMSVSEPPTLWVAAGITPLGGADPSHRALLVRDGVITWAGADPFQAPPHDVVHDLSPGWLTPGFVDAHVHGTATGLMATGLDVSGARSVAEVLARVRAHDAAVVYGSGWDDLGWPEGRPPRAEELTAAAGGRPVLLIRVDGHSSVVDAGTLAVLDVDGPHVDRDADGAPTGWLREDASAAAVAHVRSSMPAAQIAAAREETCRAALGLGITSFHEMGIPALSEVSDAVAWADGPWPLDVQVWWADLAADPGGPLRPGGDLFVDGAIGSCTAATTVPYRTNGGALTTGVLHHDAAALTEFFATATRGGVGAGVHAIGDAAIEAALQGLEGAAAQLGINDVRGCRHRVEHLELATREHVRRAARLAIVASVQPAFDAEWNGPGGMYEHRFGRARADTTNPFAWFAAAGVPMAFGSDSPVTPLDPWGGVLAAERHHAGLGLDRRSALEAATLGGRRAARQEQRVGALVPGLQADFVVWPGDPLHDDPHGWVPLVTVVRGHGVEP